MQEKKNKRLALLLIVLLSVILAFVLVDRPEEAFSIDKDIYKGFDLKAVDRVMLESGEEKTDLRFQGYRWKVNDSIDADRGLVEVLFATLQQAEPKRPVSQSLRDSVATTIRKHGVKVSLYAGENKLKTFYAGGNEAKTEAIFVGEGGTDSHVVVIPGYRVYVSGIFEIPSVGWREKLIFNFNWQSFAKMEARYKNPSGNFDVIMDRNIVSIPQIAEADTAKLNSYLDQVSLLMAEEYIRPGRLTDSISSTQPILNLSIYDIANRKYELSVYTLGNQFYGKTGTGNWALFNENRIIPILRPKDFFVRR
jgi:hypothetical protein